MRRNGAPIARDGKMTIPNSGLLTETEAAEFLRVAVATLRRWRWSGRAPRFVKIGNRVRYEVAALNAVIEDGRRTSTTDPGEAA